MAKRMLIDANHPEETRVVVSGGTRLEDFDYETAAKKQLKGNIYLAKITRVEPSLQAAFVEYGGNRHGFLPSSEIHPDYYRIPIADRAALMAEESAVEEVAVGEATADPGENGNGNGNGAAAPASDAETDAAEMDDSGADDSGADNGEAAANVAAAEDQGADAPASAASDGESLEEVEVEENVDTVGGDEVEDVQRKRAMLLRRYKIQEVIKRRQVILVQVTKEERGNKGAALTTYLSLAGRYCVLMPNTNKGGGISRKISSPNDRRRLKQILAELKIPDGVAVIVRTAGSQRSKVEIRRDYEYLMRLWSEIRETTLNSSAPALIHEEGNLVKRSIRDLYNSEMEEILVEGESGYKLAKSFMKSLMPSHARKVHLYKDETTPLFHRFQVESQLDAMHSNTVQLRSGGYLVLNPTEALVAIDVNSGKATRERHIEETALKTNLEAAEEVGRQLRLRDLAGLIVIDFIDMEESRHNRDVERKLKEALRHDRARIQLGRISPFGLLEMSRQRLRPSLQESSTNLCPRCGGIGHIRTTESSALHALRGIEDEGTRNKSSSLRLSVASDVALYILNQKRQRLIEIEERYGLQVEIASDDSLVPPEFGLERLSGTGVATKVAPAESADERADEDEDDRKRGRKRRSRRRKDDLPAEVAADSDSPVETVEAADGEEEPRKRRRRGKRGGRRRSKGQSQTVDAQAETAESSSSIDAGAEQSEPQMEAAGTTDGPTAEVIDSVAETADDAVPAESESLAIGDDEAAGESKPKRRRAPRRRKPAAKKSAETEKDGETVEAGDGEPTEAGASDSDGGKKPARRSRSGAAKPRRRTPKKSAEASEQKPSADEAPDGDAPSRGEAVAEPGPAPHVGNGVAAEDRPLYPAAAAQAATPPVASATVAPSQIVATPAPDSEPAATPDEPESQSDQSSRDEPSSDSAPKRRGWWNRLV